MPHIPQKFAEDTWPGDIAIWAMSDIKLVCFETLTSDLQSNTTDSTKDVSEIGAPNMCPSGWPPLLPNPLFAQHILRDVDAPAVRWSANIWR